GNCRHTPEPMKQQWVTMPTHMKSSDIARVTHSSHRTVNRALRLLRLAGSVVQKPLQAGRPRLLTDHAVACVALLTSPSQYLDACVEHTPDIFLLELQRELREARDVDAPLTTVDRTLHRRGYSRKQVNHAARCIAMTNIGYSCRDQLWNATRSSVTYIKYVLPKNFNLISLFLSMNQPATVLLQDDQ
ncbi:hypothetical protein M405DRAFT_743703, partial [Rhizopogon salebrosus TDB-379]